MKIFFKFKFIIFMCFIIVGCSDLAKRADMYPKDITVKDFKELTTPLPPRLEKPRIEELAEEKPTYPAKFYKKISVSISDNISLRSVLEELTQSIGVDLQLDPEIKSPVIFQATDRPFVEVIEDICDMSRLRFSIKNNRIRIERDHPYSKTYNVQFLNFVRKSHNTISIATDIFNSGAGATEETVSASSSPSKNANKLSANASNGSDSQVNVEASNDFWAELETNLNLLIGPNLKKIGEKENDDSEFDIPQKQNFETKNHIKNEQNKNKEKNKKKVNKNQNKKNPDYSIHKQGGLITVYADEKTQNRIKAYLDRLKIAASSQILIEAKIIEVILNKEYQSGINWNKIGNGLNFDGTFGNYASSSNLADLSSNTQNLVSFGYESTNFKSILNLLEQFGYVRTLSSPRLTVMNNQAAILKIAKNQVYFRLNYDKQFATPQTNASSSVSSTIQTVPIGLIMTVQPSINVDTGEVILYLRPTISKFNKTVSDPAVTIAYNAALSDTGTNASIPASNVPVVEVREIDSIMKLHDGEIGILGGLMEVMSYEDYKRIPGVEEVPLLKELFSSVAKGDTLVELVILLKVKISKGTPLPDSADERLRTDYIADPRKW